MDARTVMSSPAAAGGYSGSVMILGDWLMYRFFGQDIPNEVTVALMTLLFPIFHALANIICRKLDCYGQSGPAEQVTSPTKTP